SSDLERAPSRDAVHVRGHLRRPQRLQLRVADHEGVLHEAEHLEVPGGLVEPRDRPVVEDRPALHQALARGNAGGDLLGVLRSEQIGRRGPPPATPSMTPCQILTASPTSSAATSRWARILPFFATPLPS